MNEQDRDASRTRARMPALGASRLRGASECAQLDAPPAHDSLLDEINSALQLLLDRIHCGLILLSADGTVVYLNRYASRIAHAGDAIAIRSRRLLFLDRNTQEQFRDRLRAACVAPPAADVERSFAFRVTRVHTQPRVV